MANGVPGIEMQKQFDTGKDGFNLYWWRLIEHAGTHMDAPIHFSAAGASAEKIDAGSTGSAAGIPKSGSSISASAAFLVEVFIRPPQRATASAPSRRAR